MALVMNGDKQPTRRNKHTHTEKPGSQIRTRAKTTDTVCHCDLILPLGPGKRGPCPKPQELRGPCSGLLSISPLCRARSPRGQGMWAPEPLLTGARTLPASLQTRHTGPQNSLAEQPPVLFSGAAWASSLGPSFGVQITLRWLDPQARSCDWNLDMCVGVSRHPMRPLAVGMGRGVGCQL